MNGVFYMVVRIFVDSTTHNSVEYFKEEDYNHDTDVLERAASARLYNIVSADLQNQNVKYQMAYILDNHGEYVIPPIVYDRREPEPEE